MRQLRVLVVDDEPDTVTTLSAILRYDGYDVSGCHSGKEALGMLRDFDPDAVVTDIGMPGMTGWDLAVEIRKRCGAARPLLVAITGQYTKDADRMEAQKTGFNYYLAKPCDSQVLSALLQNFGRGVK
jgi:two-component system, OmpR family, response regulator